MNLLKHIPNALTSLNLLCGCVGVMYSFTGRIEYAIYCIWVAMVFDFLDGFSARMLDVSSSIGKELDSLADMVTFGVLPSMLMFQYLSNYQPSWSAYFGFSIAIFSALRLAKFNVDQSQNDEFIGVPTPANALFISSLYFLMLSYPALDNYALLISLTFITSFWLVIPLELLSLKFKSFGLKENRWRYALIFFAIILIIAFKLIALPLIIVTYIALSVIKNILTK